MKITVSTRGYDKAAGDMAKAAAEVKVKAGRIITKTAYDIAGDAKRLAPVDTGHLKSSISTDVSGDRLSAEIGPTADYGHYVEEGTSRMAGQPYLRPATDRRLPAMHKAFDRLAGDL